MEPVNPDTPALVGLVMGSDSDWNVMEKASRALDALGIAHEVEVLSAHRTPERMIAYGQTARERASA
ncbi:hypothetical protein MAFF212519_03460 [Clavibacter michiganensis]